MTVAIQVDSLEYSFPRKRSRFKARVTHVPLLHDLSFAVREGSALALLGYSGVGKTTVLRLLAGLLAPEKGSITVLGVTPTDLQAQGVIGYVPQHRHLLPWRSVRRNVAFPVPRSGLDEDALEFAIQMMRIPDDVSARRPYRTSGGQQARAAVARALARKPEVLFMDEPFASVDPLMREALWREVRGLFSSHLRAIVFTTHIITEALVAADTILVLNRRGASSPAEVSCLPENDPQREALALESQRSPAEQKLRTALESA